MPPISPEKQKESPPETPRNRRERIQKRLQERYQNVLGTLEKRGQNPRTPDAEKRNIQAILDRLNAGHKHILRDLLQTRDNSLNILAILKPASDGLKTYEQKLNIAPTPLDIEVEKFLEASQGKPNEWKKLGSGKRNCLYFFDVQEEALWSYDDSKSPPQYQRMHSLDQWEFMKDSRQYPWERRTPSKPTRKQPESKKPSPQRETVQRPMTLETQLYNLVTELRERARRERSPSWNRMYRQNNPLCSRSWIASKEELQIAIEDGYTALCIFKIEKQHNPSAFINALGHEKMLCLNILDVLADSPSSKLIFSHPFIDFLKKNGGLRVIAKAARMAPASTLEKYSTYDAAFDENEKRVLIRIAVENLSLTELATAIRRIPDPTDAEVTRRLPDRIRTEIQNFTAQMEEVKRRIELDKATCEALQKFVGYVGENPERWKNLLRHPAIMLYPHVKEEFIKPHVTHSVRTNPEKLVKMHMLIARALWIKEIKPAQVNAEIIKRECDLLHETQGKFSHIKFFDANIVVVADNELTTNTLRINPHAPSLNQRLQQNQLQRWGKYRFCNRDFWEKIQDTADTFGRTSTLIRPPDHANHWELFHVKKEITKAIINTPPPLLLYLSMHGGPDGVSIGGIRFTVEELAYCFTERAKNFGRHMHEEITQHQNYAIHDRIAGLNCFSTDWLHNFYSSLRRRSRDISIVPPICLGEAEIGQFGFTEYDSTYGSTVEDHIIQVDNASTVTIGNIIHADIHKGVGRTNPTLIIPLPGVIPYQIAKNKTPDEAKDQTIT